MSTLTGSDAMLFEDAFYIGMVLQNIMYGIYLVLYFKTMRILLTRRREHRQSNIFYAVFSSGMLLLITVWVCVAATLGHELWLPDQNYSPGPLAYGERRVSNIYMGFGVAATIILQQMTDGLMLYRCRNVWGSHCAIILPSILWLAEIVLGVLVLWTSSTHEVQFSSGLSAKLGLAYYSISVFLNAALACMICYRLVCHARTVGEHLAEHAPPYSSVVVLLVESVLPYTLSGIAFLVSYGMGSRTAVTFSCVYTMMMCISPQMLILRVAEGRAWKKHATGSSAPMMIFSAARRHTTSSSRSSEGRRDSNASGVTTERITESSRVGQRSSRGTSLSCHATGGLDSDV